MSHEWYEIRVKGNLPGDWSNWFEGMDIRPALDGDSILAGHLADQAALYGVLAKIRNLNLTLISVNQRSQEQTTHER